MNKVLFLILILLIVGVFGNNFKKFYFEKNYTFTVEAPCDITTSTCFVRDCSGGDCPPNNLDRYRIFTLLAKDFDRCTSGSCLVECSLGHIQCVEQMCGESEDDICSQVTTTITP